MFKEPNGLSDFLEKCICDGSWLENMQEVLDLQTPWQQTDRPEFEICHRSSGKAEPPLWFAFFFFLPA